MNCAMVRKQLSVLVIALLAFGSVATLAAAQDATPEASPVAGGTIEIFGLVDTPLTLSVADLQAFTPQTVEVTFESKGEPQTHTYTGVLLSDVIASAVLTLDPDAKNQALHRYLVISASDGYEVVISWGEIDPGFGANPYLLAWEEDGAALEGESGPVRLVVPGDIKGGRYVSGIVTIEVRDIDSPARES